MISGIFLFSKSKKVKIITQIQRIFYTTCTTLINTLSSISLFQKTRSIDFAIRNPERRQVSLRVPLDLIDNLPKWMESSNFEKCDVIIKGVMKSSYLGTHYQIPMIYLEYVPTSTIQLQSEALLRQTGVITAM